MKFGLVAKPLGIAVPWTTPPLISGYLATGKISGAVIQLVNLAIGGLVYYPFFKMLTVKLFNKKKQNAQK